MFQRITMSLLLALSLTATACVEDADPTSTPTPAERAVTVEVDVPQSRVPGTADFALTPNAVCGQTFCANKPPWTTCYCYVGSGLWRGSTCSNGCNDVPITD